MKIDNSILYFFSIIENKELFKFISKNFSNLLEFFFLKNYENIDDTFCVIKNNGMKLEFFLEAWGSRKFGLLWRLLRKGLIEKDTILFWDEPEANINPELMSVLVEIIFELEKNGIQIFIAT